MKKYVLILMDGAGDLARFNGITPLRMANMPWLDKVTTGGFTGRMQTLYEDLPKGSIVSQLGILGYEPYKYYPNGRASCEALAIDVGLSKDDVAFRANLALIEDSVLTSFNANYIKSKYSVILVEKLNKSLRSEFPDIELHHNSDFRNTLIYRDVGIAPEQFICPQPHENMGKAFDFSNLVSSKDSYSTSQIRHLNEYIYKTSIILGNEKSNIIFPWSPSSQLVLHEFKKFNKSAIIAHMDFLNGISKAAKIDFYGLGNGNWDTDYAAKGSKILELLADSYEFIYCHINAPDEASHMGDLEKKIYSLEMIDKEIIAPVYNYFTKHKDELGGVLVTTDHYTNLFAVNLLRLEAHSMDLVPFVIWNGRDVDSVKNFDEDRIANGTLGKTIPSHLEILDLLKYGLKS